MPYSAMSAWWSGLRRSARIPPCTFGCSVTTRWPRIGREAGELGDVGDREAGVAQGLGGAAAGDEVPAEAAELAGQLDDPGLVVDGEQRPHRSGHLLLEERGVGEDRSDGVRGRGGARRP